MAPKNSENEARAATGGAKDASPKVDLPAEPIGKTPELKLSARLDVPKPISHSEENAINTTAPKPTYLALKLPARSSASQYETPSKEKAEADSGSTTTTLNRAAQAQPTILLGYQTLLLSHPEKLPDGGRTNFLIEQWKEKHGEARVGFFNPDAATQAAIESTLKIQALGLKAEVSENLSETLRQLARDTVSTLQAQGAEFSEAEYVYAVSETVAAWLEKNPESTQVLQVQGNPAGVLQEALEYNYRREIGAVYNEAAHNAAVELVSAAHTPEQRLEVIEKHFPCGDRELFAQKTLQAERTILAERAEILVRELQCEFSAKYGKQLEQLASRPKDSVEKFNESIDKLKTISLLPRK